MGYGRRALDMLTAFFQGDLANLDEADKFVTENDGMADGNVVADGGDLMTEEIKPRRNLPPLLTKLEECKPQRLQWLGTSYGITLQLFNFWSKAGFLPTYVRLTSNELTGEHSCIMMKSLRAAEDSMEFAMNPQWLNAFHEDFKRRFISLLSYEFANMAPALALSVLAYKPNVVLGDPTSTDGSFAQLAEVKPEFDLQFSRFDIKRLGTHLTTACCLSIIDTHRHGLSSHVCVRVCRVLQVRMRATWWTTTSFWISCRRWPSTTSWASSAR
jgi:N-acetyltransferase 10